VSYYQHVPKSKRYKKNLSSAHSERNRLASEEAEAGKYGPKPAPTCSLVEGILEAEDLRKLNEVQKRLKPQSQAHAYVDGVVYR
jgi:hypothetical protein